MKITREEILKSVSYDPDTGIFTRVKKEAKSSKDRTWNTRWCGQPAGHLDSVTGSLRMMINGKNHYGRRLAFIIMTGKTPPGRVVFRDGDVSNLAWSNLTTFKLMKEQLKDLDESPKECRHPGVVFNAHENRWRAVYCIGMATLMLGYYITEQEAIEARKIAIERLAA